MITQNDVLEAVRSAVLGIYPDATVYSNLVPRDFARPSFLVETTNIQVVGSSCGAATLRLQVHVVCFEEVDEYHNTQLEALNVRQLAVLGLFAAMYLPVCDRALDVVELTGSPGGRDWIDVTATLEWDEDLNEFRALAELPNMETIHFRRREQ